MERFREVELVLLTADLAGFTRAVAALDPVTPAHTLTRTTSALAAPS